MAKKKLVLLLLSLLGVITAFVSRSLVPIAGVVLVYPFVTFGKDFTEIFLALETIIGIAMLAAFGISVFVYPKCPPASAAVMYAEQFAVFSIFAYAIAFVKEIGKARPSKNAS